MPSMRKSLLFTAFFFFLIKVSHAQDTGDYSTEAPPLPGLDTCDGVFISYTFNGRTKEYPHVKNASAQAYAFKASATVLNTMATGLQAWKLFIRFQHKEILVSAGGAVLVDAGDFPVNVENGTTFMGYPNTDLPSSIETAGDINQIQATINIVGTQFGVKGTGIPMPKKIELVNDGFICPKVISKGGFMSSCCIKDPKKKHKKIPPIKFLPRRYGDLNMVYDVLQAYGNNYQAQVTIDNVNPLGRLDNWNLTWEWKRGEFINSMRGAYTFKKDGTDCLYGEQAKSYGEFDFSNIMNCERKPVITDLPPEKEKDNQMGNIPNCCKNGTLLPPIMINGSLSQSIFQLNVFKLPPDNSNRTALYPPQNWKINGVLNPHYTCGPPMRVSPTEFPDQTGLMSHSYAIASWQVVCNITRPKAKQARCCVSFSAYFNDSVVPCSTCACGCSEDSTCNQNARALLLPAEALLIPAENRTNKAKAWAQLKHLNIPKKLPCPDNCGVSINWHINADYKKGWSARITLFNWEGYTFKNWFTAIQIPKAYHGYENVYSFNGTQLPKQNNTLFFSGLPGLNYLNPVVDGKDAPRKSEFRVPGKQQSIISFTKKQTPGIKILRGDGFPTKVFFNGEECSLPDHLPVGSGAGYGAKVEFLVSMALMVVAAFMLNM